MPKTRHRRLYVERWDQGIYLGRPHRNRTRDDKTTHPHKYLALHIRRYLLYTGCYTLTRLLLWAPPKHFGKLGSEFGAIAISLILDHPIAAFVAL